MAIATRVSGAFLGAVWQGGLHQHPCQETRGTRFVCVLVLDRQRIGDEVIQIRR
jgi:hypothetical protein